MADKRATSVTGAGRRMSASHENSELLRTVAGGTPEGGIYYQSVTTYYTDVRETRKWYALTASAITTWEAANAGTSNYVATCVNEITETWELEVTTVTRTITGIRFLIIPEI